MSTTRKICHESSSYLSSSEFKLVANKTLGFACDLYDMSWPGQCLFSVKLCFFYCFSCTVVTGLLVQCFSWRTGRLSPVFWILHTSPHRLFFSRGFCCVVLLISAGIWLVTSQFIFAFISTQNAFSHTVTEKVHSCV